MLFRSILSQESQLLTYEPFDVTYEHSNVTYEPFNATYEPFRRTVWTCFFALSYLRKSRPVTYELVDSYFNIIQSYRKPNLGCCAG